MTQQLDLTVWRRTEPIAVAHRDPLRTLDPRRDVVERACPELAGLGSQPPSVGLLYLPLSMASEKDVAAAYYEDDTVAVAQCNVCGSPVSETEQPDERDPYRHLFPEDHMFPAVRWMTLRPCGHGTSDVDSTAALVTMTLNLTDPRQVTDWLHAWAAFYWRPRPDPVDPEDSPPALFDSDGTVLQVRQEEA